MEELLKFLEKNPIFYLATDDNGQPRVRPFGFHMIFDDKFYMVTALPKKVCKQMEKNPKIEFCSMARDTQYVRVSGEVVFDNDNMEAKKKVFVTNAFRALKKVAPEHNLKNISNVVLVGGSAEDFEIPEMLMEEFANWRIVCGRGNIRGSAGPRNAVATGLVLSYAGEKS